tara:strand:+ start:1744 stop:3096 length:1353 start_codon:yes stop_codon:yes gene_type:complete
MIKPFFTQFIDNIGKDNNNGIIVYNEITYSYDDLYKNILSFIDEFKKRKIYKKIVYLNSDYSFNSISAFFALAYCKNIIIPNVSKLKSELEQRIDIISPDYTVSFENDNKKLKFHESISNSVKHPLIKSLIDNNIPGIVLFSSGSTGRPKAMIHDLNMLLSTYLDKKKKGLTFVLMLLFDHIGGINTLFNCISMGAKIIIPKSKTPESISYLIDKYKINVLPSSPTFLNLILIGGFVKNYSFKSLRLVTYGTERMPEELLNRLKKTFNRVKFLQTFGTSETGIATTKSESSNSTFFEIVDKEQEYKIVKKELWLRSKTQIKGYINSSNESFTEDGWFKTGDLVEVKGNYFKIIGRKNEVINVGGEKVLPSEVENVIMEIEDIIDCTVSGEDSPLIGQYVVADIVTNHENKKKIKSLVRDYCKSKLDKYKVPVKITFKESIEHTERFKKKR